MSDPESPPYVHVATVTILPFVQDSDGVWRWSGHVDERPALDTYEPSPDLAALIEHLAAETP